MRQYLARIGLRKIETIFKGGSSLVVEAGPFKGMRLRGGSCGSVWVPKLVGSYECELSPYVEEVVARQPDLLIDLGCAEGYFAIGFAVRSPKTMVLAADTNPFARQRTRQLARLNKVRARVRTAGWISPARLESELARAAAPVLWCDIEGGEAPLLNPDHVPSLRKAWLMVEDHQHSRGLPAREFAARFAVSHDCMAVSQVPRIPSNWLQPNIDALLTADQRQLALSELRPKDQVWHIFRPRL
jgi:hypothetical protein